MNPRLLIPIFLIAVLAGCGKENAVDFNQAPDAGETSTKRAENIREAFKEAAANNPADENTTRQIRRTFDALAKKGRTYDVDGTLQFIDFEALSQVLESIAPEGVVDSDNSKQLMNGLRKGASTGWFRKGEGIFDWQQVKVMRVETSDDGKLALVYTRHETGKDGTLHKIRWWLHNQGNGWRIYDWEFLDTSIRMSRLLLAGLLTMLNKGTGWTKHLAALQLANTAVHNGDFQQALDLLSENNPADFPRDMQAVRLEYIAVCYLSLNRPAKALQSVQSALSLKPDFPDALFVRGRVYFAMEEYEKARADFESYIDILGSDANAMLKLADCLTWLDDYDEAEKMYIASLHDTPNYFAVLGLAYIVEPSESKIVGDWFSKLTDLDASYDTIIVELYDNQGLIDVSESINEAYRKVSPGDVDLAWYTARIALDRDTPKKAADALKPVIERAPINEREEFRKLYWTAMARAGEAATALREANRKPEAFSYLAGECHENRIADGLDAVCEEFRKDNEQNPELHFYLGEADFLREEYKAAENHFRHGYKLVKSGDPFFNGLTHGLLDSMNYQGRGLEAYEEVGKTTDAFRYLADLMFEEKQAEALAKLIEAHSAAHDDDPELQRVQGELGWLKEEWKEATARLTAYIDSVGPKSVDWWTLQRCVRAAIRAEDFQTAIQLARQGQGEPDHYLLIVAHVASGEPAIAMKEIDEYVKQEESKEDADYWITQLYDDKDVGGKLRDEAYEQLHARFPIPVISETGND